MSALEKTTIAPLEAIARTLRADPAYTREGHTARSLVHAPDLRVVLVAIRAGATMATHQAAHTVTVHLVSGALRLQVPGATLELAEGQLLQLEAGLPHDVLARADSAFVLTLGHAIASSSPAATPGAS